MSLPGRLCLLIILLVVAPALIICVSKGGHLDRAASARAGNGEDFWAILGWQDPDDDSRRRDLIDAIMQRWFAKERVMTDLFARRITLLEAAARFRDLHLTGPPFDWSTWRIVMHDRFANAANDDECMCRHVIDGMEMMLTEGSEEARLVIGRLEAELDEHLRRGTLRLRPPAPTQAESSPEQAADR
jgi:hypothetical protein